MLPVLPRKKTAPPAGRFFHAERKGREGAVSGGGLSAAAKRRSARGGGGGNKNCLPSSPNPQAPVSGRSVCGRRRRRSSKTDRCIFCSGVRNGRPFSLRRRSLPPAVRGCLPVRFPLRRTRSATQGQR